MSADESRIEKLMERERLEYIGEVVDGRRVLDEKVQDIKKASFLAGHGESSRMNLQIAKVKYEYRADLIKTRIAIRRRFAAQEPALLSPTLLDELRDQMERFVQTGYQADRDEYVRRSRAAGQAVARRGDAVMDAKADELLALFGREIEKLKLEASLGLQKESSDSISVSISHSVVGAVNLGSVQGDVNSAVTVLSERGDADVAAALKEVADAVARSAELDEVRQREILEVLVALADQARLPADKRRMAVVKTLYEATAGSLSVAGNVAQVWSTFGPQIAAFFGLPV